MEGPPLGPGGEDITWPDQVAPRGRKASSTRKIKPQTSNRNVMVPCHLKYRDSSGIFAGTLRCLFLLPPIVRLGMACISYAFHVLTSA